MGWGGRLIAGRAERRTNSDPAPRRHSARGPDVQGWNPTLFQSSAQSNARPAAITVFTLRMSEISRSGRPATRMRSARLPASIVPDLPIELHRARRHDRGRLDGFHGRHARLDVELQLSMEAVAGYRLVRPGDDRHARLVEGPEHLEVFSEECVGVLLQVSAGRPSS